MSANKPVNIAKERCSPVSSNCVIWQGPDLPCISLCKGDAISEVIYKIACKICDLVDQTDVSTYDYTCLNLDKCDLPDNFRQLIQVLIDTVCALQTATGVVTPATTGCPTCEIVTASCFQAELGPYANMDAYIVAIGQKVCEQEVIIENQNIAIQQLIERVTVLEA